MSDEILERFVRDCIQSVTVEQVEFSLQGGEPSLMGLGFFEKVVALQKKHAEPTFDAVYAAAMRLLRSGVPFNTLTSSTDKTPRGRSTHAGPCAARLARPTCSSS